MTTKDGYVCPHCGALIVTYSHSFNSGLAKFLIRLYDAGCPVRTDDLGLTYAQRTNSQKLRYWELAEPHINEDSKRRAGWWKITKVGINFVNCKILIQKTALVKRNVVVGFRGDLISFDEVYGGYKHRIDYRREARDGLSGEY